MHLMRPEQSTDVFAVDDSVQELTFTAVPCPVLPAFWRKSDLSRERGEACPAQKWGTKKTTPASTKVWQVQPFNTLLIYSITKSKLVNELTYFISARLPIQTRSPWCHIYNNYLYSKNRSSALLPNSKSSGSSYRSPKSSEPVAFWTKKTRFQKTSSLCVL